LQLPNRGFGLPAAIDRSSATGWSSLVITTSSPSPSLPMISGNFAWASSMLMLDGKAFPLFINLVVCRSLIHWLFQKRSAVVPTTKLKNSASQTQ
jgi:hypothetical protein